MTSQFRNGPGSECRLLNSVTDCIAARAITYLSAYQLTYSVQQCFVGGWLNTSSIVISIGATASVRYREVVRSWEGPLWEVPLYTILYSSCTYHVYIIYT